jgi:FixJ family two-component response regulator
LRRPAVSRFRGGKQAQNLAPYASRIVGRVRMAGCAMLQSLPSSTMTSRFRQALERFLGTLAFRVRAFESGEEFLQSGELSRVACLLLDLAMPGMSGLEVKQQLASRGLRIPTLFVTAHAADDVQPSPSTAGAIAILPKPVDQQMLFRLVRKVIGDGNPSNR